MAAVLLLGLVFFVLAIVLSVLAIYRIFRIISIILTVLLLLLTLASVALYADSREVQNALNSEKLFVLEKNGVLVAAFVHRNSVSSRLLSDISAERAGFAAKNLNAVRGNRSLVFITTPAPFSRLETVALEGRFFETGRILFLLEQEDPREEYAAAVRQQVSQDREVVAPDMSAEEFKGFLFASLVNSYLQSGTVAHAIRSGEILVYPRSITMWAIRSFPSPLLALLVADEVS